MAFDSGCSVLGSLNSCSAASTVNRVHMAMAGRIRATFTRSAIWSSEAPSILAASWISGGSARRDVYITTMLKPTAPHTAMLATET